MNKLRSKSGMTLTELISGIIVLLLVAGILTVGVRLGAKAYVESVSASEAQVLCATLTELVTDELRYAGTTEGTGTANDPVKIFSQRFGGSDNTTESAVLAFATDDHGHIYLQDTSASGTTTTTGAATSGSTGTDTSTAEQEPENLILSTAAYPYNLHAYVETLTYDEGTRIFAVTLNVQGSSGNTLATTSFEVRKVNP